MAATEIVDERAEPKIEVADVPSESGLAEHVGA